MDIKAQKEHEEDAFVKSFFIDDEKDNINLSNPDKSNSDSNSQGQPLTM